MQFCTVLSYTQAFAFLFRCGVRRSVILRGPPATHAGGGGGQPVTLAAPHLVSAGAATVPCTAADGPLPRSPLWLSASATSLRRSLRSRSPGPHRWVARCAPWGARFRKPGRVYRCCRFRLRPFRWPHYRLASIRARPSGINMECTGGRRVVTASVIHP